MNKDELIEKYRYESVEWEDWNEYPIGRFIEWMKALGVDIDIDNIQYSGFCSQGDGASFTCTIDGKNFDTYARFSGLYDSYPILEAAYLAGCEPTIKVDRNSRNYSHGNTVGAEVYCEYTFMDVVADDGNELLVSVAEALDDTYSIHFNWDNMKVEEDVNTDLRWCMKQLYIALERLYDELTSDDNVWEMIQANGWDEPEGVAHG